MGKAEAECLGYPGLPLAIVPHPVADRSPEEIVAIAEAAADEVVHLLETDAGALAEECKARTPPARKMRYKGLFSGDYTRPDAPREFKGPDGLDQVVGLFYQRGWTDGLPIVAPTEARRNRGASWSRAKRHHSSPRYSTCR